MDEAEVKSWIARLEDFIQGMDPEDACLLLGAAAGVRLAHFADTAFDDWVKFVRKARDSHRGESKPRRH